MTTTGPSIEGVDRIRQAAAYLKPYEPPKRRRSWWPKQLTVKRTALLAVTLLIGGNVGWHYLTKDDPKAARGAVINTANAASHNDWSAVYERLCTSDQRQFTETELHDAGRVALLSIGELDHVTVSAVKPVKLTVGVMRWPAEQVSGQLVPVIGQPSDYTVTVIQERGTWKMCLSAGGYSSTAMHVNVPLGSGSLGF
ncbi:MAG: hypothetical protein JO214_20215 [Frankiaceae bacterium]|nr:hypothetical protein [Frankiaceae bacterium]